MKRRLLSLKPQSKAIDKQLFLVVLGLVVFGIVMVGNVSIVEAERNFGDKFFYLRQQAIWASLGFLGVFFLASFSHHRMKKLAVALFLFNVALLVLVLIPGLGIKALGAKRWLSVGQFVLQPAEFIKLTLSLYLAKLLSQNRALLPFVLSVGLVLGLVMAEPDLGTSVIIGGFSALVYFASGAPLFYFAALAPVATLGILGLILTSEYRKERLMTFLNPTVDPLGASYHIRQVLIALGSGGLFGVGLGQSRQKYLFLPEVRTDSIFAVIGEELGLLGTLAIVGAFVFIAWRGFNIAKRVEDPFSRILAVSITSWIVLQAFVNLGTMVAVLPLTGVPLPFISYGGSSLVTALFSIGILLNISKEQGVKV